MSICFLCVCVSPFLYEHSFTIFGAIVTNLNERHRAIAASGPRPATINELKNGENNRSAVYSKPVSKKKSKQTKVMFVPSYEFRL